MLQRVSDEKIASSLEHKRYVWCKDSFVSLLVVAVCWKESRYLYYKAREQTVWLFHPPAEDCVVTHNLPNRMLICQFSGFVMVTFMMSRHTVERTAYQSQSHPFLV